MDENKAVKMVQDRYTSLRIIKMIQNGHRSSTLIAKKLGVSKQLAHWYLKVLEAQDDE